MNINVDLKEMSEELSKLITNKIQSGEIGISQITLVEPEKFIDFQTYVRFFLTFIG